MRIIYATIFMLCLCHVLQAQDEKGQEYHLLIGTYSSKGNTNGIHVYRFNTRSGAFKMTRPVTELANASYLAISKDRKNVYAVSESSGEGSVNAFTFNPESGALDFMNSVPATGPCYVAVDDHKKVVFVGNYGGGSVQAAHLNPEGSLEEDKVQTIQHIGSSVVKGRQEKPHVHAAVLSKDNRYLLVPDLGTDKVNLYGVDVTKAEALTIAEMPFLAVAPGGGPRHLTFHPNGKYAYLVLEIEGAVMALDYHHGKLTAKQTISMMDDSFKGRVSGADIHVSPDGKFLYASNRGDANEIAIYSINKTGALTFIKRQSVLGETPRNFAIDPTGNFLLAANLNTNEVIIFKRDGKTGLLASTGKKIEVEKPVCLKFVPVAE